MGIQQDVIKKFAKSLHNSSKYGTAALDEAINYASSGIYSSWSALVTAFVSDVSLYGGEGSSSSRTLDSKTSSFLLEYCGIDLTNTDTGAITGYDAGGSTTQIGAEDIVPETSGTATYPSESTTTYNGVTIIWPDKSSLTSKQQEIISALYTWWIPAALNLVEASIGLSYSESDVNSKTMTITFTDRTSSSVLASANNTNLTINTSAWDSLDITGANNSGKRTRGTLADRVIAHEFTHAVIAANVNETLWDNDLVASSEGLAELIHGADDGRKSEIVNLAQSVNASRLEKALYYTYSSSEDYYDAYAGGYMLFRYLAKQVSNKLFTGTAVVDLTKAGSSEGNFTVTSTTTGKVNATFTTGTSTESQTQVGEITSGRVYSVLFDSAQIISALASALSWNITGSSYGDTITGGSAADSINGGEGDDMITGSKGNDTLTGGSGDDTFFYANGDGVDVITDYTVDEDIIKLTSGSIKSSSLSGSDVVLNVGSGSIKILNGATKSITVTDSTGSTTSKVYGIPEGVLYNTANTVITLNADFAGTLNSSEYYSTVRTINASSRTEPVYIIGNANANKIQGGSSADTIYGGAGKDSLLGGSGNDLLCGDAGNDFLSGGAGADTLIGGKGNDTLTGGAGKDVFVYASGYGDDVITDYTSGQDKIKLTSGSVTSSAFDDSDLILNIGSGSIKIKNGKGKTITFIDSSGKSSNKSYQETSTLTVTDSDSATVTIDSSYQNVDASSRTKAVKITGNSLNNTIKSGKGNDTLTGGTGKDVFVYAFGDGNDIITDYTTGEDSIKLSAASIKSASLSGSDVVLKIASSAGSVKGSITVKNAKNKSITVIDSDGNSTSKVYAGSTILTVTDSDLATITASSTIKTVNASKRTKAVNIIGNSNANVIKGGSGNDKIFGDAGNDSLLGNEGNDSLSGGAGADTLVGGKGDDTLTGGIGKDVFVYAAGDGNDVITDYTAGQDSIKLTSGKITASSISGSNLILTVGSDSNSSLGTIKVKNGKGKIITVVDSSGNSTSKIYTTSKSFAEEHWFLENVECDIQSSELDSILDDKSNMISVDCKFNSEKTLVECNQITYDNKFKQSHLLVKVK